MHRRSRKIAAIHFGERNDEDLESSPSCVLRQRRYWRPGPDEVKILRPNRRASTESAPGPISASESADAAWRAAVTTSEGTKTPSLKRSRTLLSWTAVAAAPARGVAKPANSRAETVPRPSTCGTLGNPFLRAGSQRLPDTAILRRTRANPGIPAGNIVKSRCISRGYIGTRTAAPNERTDLDTLFRVALPAHTRTPRAHNRMILKDSA